MMIRDAPLASLFVLLTTLILLSLPSTNGIRYFGHLEDSILQNIDVTTVYDDVVVINRVPVYEIRGGSQAEPDEAFKRILRDLQKTYKIISLPPTTLPLPFTSFHSKFLSSSSPFSFPKFHENLEDKNVESTEWTDGPSMSRVMKFLHPIGKNPVGPSETRVTKTQTLLQTPTHLTLTSTSQIHDVPSSSSFLVRDVLLLRPLSDSSCEVRVFLNVEWSSFSVIKSIVNKSTERDVGKWWGKWVEDVLEFLK
ncbi:hypothetical protein TrLO_g13345 [Triparma laevis f. longispina]|uniref:VASt domain-containing protein n=1 Tax=Triparma laevis f. longispina TaxID=1714387 RepID=A0A9W7FHL3_9STRA|nr:hypothetical protein TrLO_g13345 [Triparma laevis f. longispina]